MSSVTNPPSAPSIPGTPGSVLPPAVSEQKQLPRSETVGRTIQRIRTAELERRDLQREAERLLKMGAVVQCD